MNYNLLNKLLKIRLLLNNIKLCKKWENSARSDKIR